MLISEALKLGDTQKLAEVFASFGMHCLGCLLAHGETVEQAAAVHGIDADALVKELNFALK